MACSMVYSKSLLTNVVKTFPIVKTYGDEETLYKQYFLILIKSEVLMKHFIEIYRLVLGFEADKFRYISSKLAQTHCENRKHAARAHFNFLKFSTDFTGPPFSLHNRTDTGLPALRAPINVSRGGEL